MPDPILDTPGPMTTFGCLLSCEEFTPEQLIEQAQLAERAGFTRLAVSDHYHPWIDAGLGPKAARLGGRIADGLIPLKPRADLVADAGFDEISVNPVGPGYRGFFDFYGSEVLPEMGSA